MRTTPILLAGLLLATALVPAASASSYVILVPTLPWQALIIKDADALETDPIGNPAPEEPGPVGEGICPDPTTVGQLVCNTLGFVDPIVQFGAQQVGLVITEADRTRQDGEAVANGGIAAANNAQNAVEATANQVGQQAVATANQVIVGANAILLIVDGGIVTVVGIGGDFGDFAAGTAKDNCVRNVPGPACGLLPGSVSQFLP